MRTIRGALLLAALALLGSSAAGEAALTGLPRLDAKADLVVVIKHEHRLYLLRNGQVLESFRIMLGRDPIGTKVREGDGRTPEGIYWIDRRNPDSLYHRSLHISYPEPEDVARARMLGVRPGGNIMIHGLPNGFVPRTRFELQKDWTNGCIAMSDRDVDTVWSMVDDGTPIDIEP